MDVEEFLGLKGAVPLLCELNEEGVSFSDLEDNLPVATSTFNIRREQALNLDLIEVVGEQLGSRGRHVYTLTEKGKEIRDLLDERGVTQTYQQYRLLEEQYIDEKVSFLDSVSLSIEN